MQVDWAKLRALHTKMNVFCVRVGQTVFASKPGFYIPKTYLVGEDIDHTNLNEVTWAEATRCQPQVNEFFFDTYSMVIFPLSYTSATDSNGREIMSRLFVAACSLPRY